MLYQLLANHPEAIVQIVKQTPTWVWGLFSGLMVLGVTQLRDRTQSLARVSIMPVAMTVFSAWGMVSAFGNSPHFTGVLAAWIVTAAIVGAVVSLGDSGARYDAATRSYALPGSVVPLLLIAGIFLTKYWVGVELAMQPQLVRDASFALPVATLYGVFNGLFAGRAARLWKLAHRASPMTAAA
ncbi:DUF6622 family protein [Caenimonas aquaedulcis]|uniref:Transmembrane protein n=1 Tax=Caenimonas aquaedulcis TaxID=2793270 RepID=A0A931H399_9BURK|nr:DUF6622 family protein [Caenimonas aquaedulcis]MBG9387732.1 hypothetical protein [Caenimonas aquaedulcis]